MKKLILRFVCSANDIITIPLLYVFYVLWGKTYYWEGLCFCVELAQDSWPVNKHKFLGGWYSKWRGTTFGHAIMYHNPEEKTRIHEHIHVHQYHASMLKSSLTALCVLLITGKLWLSYIIWSFGYLSYILINLLTSWLRGNSDIYRESVHEEHAYKVGESLWNPQNLTNYQNKYKTM